MSLFWPPTSHQGLDYSRGRCPRPVPGHPAGPTHSSAAVPGCTGGGDSASPSPECHIPLLTTSKYALEEKKNVMRVEEGEGKERNVSGGIIGTGAGF